MTDVVRFVIFAAPRTGSNLLCGLLNSHPQVLCHHGLFNPAGIHCALNWRTRNEPLGSIGNRDRDPVEFLKNVWAKTDERRAVGFKLNRGESAEAAEVVLRDAGVRKILLSRRNRLETYVSELLAQQTNRWESYPESPASPTQARVSIDPAALARHADLNREYYAHLERRLYASRQLFERLDYEDLGSARELNRVLRLLGVSERAATLIAPSRKDSPGLARVLAAPEELMTALRGSEFETEIEAPPAPPVDCVPVGVSESNRSGGSIMTQLAPTETIAKSGSKADFRRHRGPVTCVAAVPGGSWAVTSAYDSAVALYNLESGEIRLLGYHRHLANSIAVDRKGERAASSSSDYDIYIWDLAKQQRIQVLRGHSDDVECFAFVDERMGVSASRDHRIIVWDLETGAIVRVLDGHEKDVLSVAYSDGMIYSSGDDMTLRQWRLSDGEMLRRWGPFEHETDTCAIDPLLGRAVLGCDDGVIRVFDIRQGGMLAEIPAHASGIKKVAVSPVNGDILSAAYDQRVRIWRSADFLPGVDLKPAPAMWERSLNWSPDGTAIVAGTFDGTVLVWNSATGGLRTEVGIEPDEPGNHCFNEVSAGANGRAAVVSDDGFVRLIELTSTAAELIAKVEPKAGRALMNAATLDETYQLVATGAHDHKLHLFALAASGLGAEIDVRLGEGPINSIRVSHVEGYLGDVFIACYSGALVRVGRDGAIRNKARLHDGAVKALRIHPCRPIGVSCSADGALISWSLDGALIDRFPGHTSIVDDVDFSPSGELVASASRDFRLNVYQLEGGTLLHSVYLGRRSPKSVCFWDENTVLVGDYWGMIIKFEIDSGRLSRGTVARNGISSLSRAGADLMASSYDGGIYLVSPADFQVRNVFRGMTQRCAEDAS